MQEGRITTTSPKKIGEPEIRVYLMWMREQGIETNGQVKYLQILNNLLRYCDNSTIDKMRKKRLLPKKKHTEINCLTEDQVEHIINSTSKITGWKGVKARFICAILPYSGLRPKELRLAQRMDLDEKTWEF